MQLLIQKRIENPTFIQAIAPKLLSSSIANKVDKTTAGHSHVSRFNL